MTKKAPRRTKERILETTLDLFNRFGEPNVSTTAISAELNISPGNLYYHYPAKDELVNALVDRFEAEAQPLLGAAGDVGDVEDAWFFLHTLFELIWAYRFIYRDLSDLLSKNRRLEKQFHALLTHKGSAMRALLAGLERGAGLQWQHAAEAAPTATRMVVLLTYWLNYEYVLDPRRALEPEHAQQALLRGAHHVLSALAPYLPPEPRRHLQALADAYQDGTAHPSAGHPAATT